MLLLLLLLVPMLQRREASERRLPGRRPGERGTDGQTLVRCYDDGERRGRERRRDETGRWDQSQSCDSSPVAAACTMGQERVRARTALQTGGKAPGLGVVGGGLSCVEPWRRWWLSVGMNEQAHLPVSWLVSRNVRHLGP